MTEMYDNPKHVEDTFNKDKLHPYLTKAQEDELNELKRIISEKSSVSILDIGVGDGRLIKELFKHQDISNAIRAYEGIDVAQDCIDISTEVVSDMGLEGKVNITQLDAVDLKTLDKKYDMIITTWFTAGNFYPFGYDIKNYTQGYDLTENDKFTSIFKQAHEMLNPDGEIIIGSMYIDTDETRKKQEETYRNFGWTITSNKEDCFTSTKEGWWSQRYTEQRVLDYLNFVPKENFSFINLDDYDYAMMVRIRK